MVLYYDWSTANHVCSHHRHREDIMAYTQKTEKVLATLKLSDQELSFRNRWADGLLLELFRWNHSWIYFLVWSLIHLGIAVTTWYTVQPNPIWWWAQFVLWLLVSCSNLLYVWYRYVMQPNQALHYLKRLRKYSLRYDVEEERYEARHLYRRIRLLNEERYELFSNLRRADFAMEYLQSPYTPDRSDLVLRVHVRQIGAHNRLFQLNSETQRLRAESDALVAAFDGRIDSL